MARACLCGILLGTMCLLHTVSGQTSRHPSERTSELVEQFKTTTTFWKQFEVAKQIVALHDKSVLQALEPWLSNEDMQLRGNAAFIFASLGDDRGFQVIKAILENRSPSVQCPCSTTQAARVLSYKFGKTVTTPGTFLGT